MNLFTDGNLKILCNNMLRAMTGLHGHDFYFRAYISVKGLGRHLGFWSKSWCSLLVEYVHGRHLWLSF